MSTEMKIVGIVGAGVSGLVACKHVLQRGFHPVVFESESSIGGVWTHTFASTRLQTERKLYEFTDLPWPAGTADPYPHSAQVMDYVSSYAARFDLFRHIKFNTKVVGIDYLGPSGREQMDWDRWSAAAGKGGGKWEISVQRIGHHTVEIYEVDFVMLCIGRFSQLPNIPLFPPGRGPEEFKGKVLHSMDYSKMDNAAAAQLIRGKRIAIIGFHKSAIDLAAECANANGAGFPCTLVRRRSYKGFAYPTGSVWGNLITVLFFSRFAELMVHKPREGKLRGLFTTLLSPLRWAISIFLELCSRWKQPLKKHGILPSRRFFEALSSCSVSMLPSEFYDKLTNGSVVIKTISESLGFCSKGLLIDNEVTKSDLVIFCTGYRGDDKLRQIFTSSRLKELVGTSTLYRGCIHPRIPQLAIIGYLLSPSILATSEMRCKWVSHLLAGRFQLPSIADMEEDVKEWEEYRNRQAANSWCLGINHIWAYDQLCHDMGCNPRRKKGFLAEWFSPYKPWDYKDI